jgi:hypothetical protein
MSEDKILKRIKYLESEIAAGGRLDGWSLKGAKKEMKKLEEKINKLNKNNESDRVNRL